MSESDIVTPEPDRLSAPEFDSLLTRLDELVRWRPGAAGSYHDAQGALKRIEGRANHVVMGRRGSGKTRLLDELRRRLQEQGTYIVTFGAEDYKELTYPDILIQILRTFLREFEVLLGHRPSLFSKEWWISKFRFVKQPVASFRYARVKADLLEDVHSLQEELEALLREADVLDAEYSTRQMRRVEQGRSVRGSVDAVGTGGFELNHQLSQEDGEQRERTTRQRELKREKVERLLGDFKHLLSSFCTHSEKPIVLAVDDFYFVRRIDQPPVIDYIHRICKDTDAFVKVATIRHRTNLNDHSEVTRGVVLGHEIQPIDLELPLGNFAAITRFLERIWRDVCIDCGVDDPEGLFIGDGFRQAVLASGGVPRDFFGIIRAAIVIARERREITMGKLRINEAARQYAEETKVPEFSVEVADQREERDLVLFDVTRFARDTKKKNCFHVDLDELQENPEMRWLLDSLVDSRLLHLITDNTSNSRRAGRYAAYLLDVGLYAHPQRRGENAIEEIEFWQRDDVGRLKNLERCPVYRLRPLEELRAATDLIFPSTGDAAE
jgi:hypothetical protein